MKTVFKIGDQQRYQVKVGVNDTATFDSGNVHPVYATFALGRDAEWCCRLFVLEMKDADEEGIGSYLKIEHKSPALLESTVNFTAEIMQMNGNEIICSFEAKVGDRLIAIGETGQKILKKEKLENLFSRLSEPNA